MNIRSKEDEGRGGGTRYFQRSPLIKSDGKQYFRFLKKCKKGQGSSIHN